MKKILTPSLLLGSIFLGALQVASASTRYYQDWGAAAGAPLGNGVLPSLGWVGIAQSQTAGPYLGTYGNVNCSDPQLGPLPTNVVFFTALRYPFQTSGPGMFYTTTNLLPTYGSTVFTNLDPTLITNLTFNVEVRNSSGTTTNYFAVEVGGAWYVATNNPLTRYTGAFPTFTNWSMVYTTNAASWNTLTIDGSQTFVTIGGKAGANLSGPISGIGIVSLNNTNVSTGSPGFNYNRIVVNQGLQDFPTSPPINSTPAIQPLGVYAGAGVSFAPTFTGSPTLVYNWQTNNGVTTANIGTGTNVTSPFGSHYLNPQSTSLTITNITVNDVTNFSVVCTNFFGKATNSGIIVNVVPKPAGLLYAETFPTIGYDGANNSPTGDGWVGISTANTAGPGGGGYGMFANNNYAAVLVPGTVGNSIAYEYTWGVSAYGTNALYTTTTNDFGLSGLPFSAINPASYPAVTLECAFAAGGNGLNGVTVYWMVQMSDPVAGTNWYSSSSPISLLGSYQTNYFAFGVDKTNWNNLTISGQLATPGSQPANNLAGSITGAGLLFIHTQASGVNFVNFAISTNAAPIIPPVIGIYYPIDTGVAAGGGASFGVATVSGTPPFGYYWTTNGVLVANGGRVSGADTATLTIANLTASDSGMQIIAYVTNSAGSDHSDVYLGTPTTLTVTTPPADLLYSEEIPFVGPVSRNYPISSIGWNEAVPGTPYTVYRRGTAQTTSQGDGAAYAYLGSAGTTVFYTTTTSDTNQAGLPFPSLSLANYTNLNFSVDIAPNSASSTNVAAYLAVELNNANWYVSATPLLGYNTASNNAYSTYSQAFATTAANWNNLTIVNGSGGTIGAPAASNLSGSMTGAGLVFSYVNNGGTFDFDNFVVTGTYSQSVVNPGSITVGTVTGGNMTLNWTANASVHLQSATNLTQAVWTDVPGTTGQSSYTAPMTGPQMFFRLISP